MGGTALTGNEPGLTSPVRSGQNRPLSTAVVRPMACVTQCLWMDTGVDRSDGGLLGSRLGNKYTLDAIYLRAAIASGLQVKPLTEVIEIYQLDPHQNARYRVEAYDHTHRRMRSYTTDHVVLAAGTLNTLRTLLRSRDKNQGLGGMPALGQNFGTNSDVIALWRVNH